MKVPKAVTAMIMQTATITIITPTPTPITRWDPKAC
jgi:hypothetical protein